MESDARDRALRDRGSSLTLQDLLHELVVGDLRGGPRRGCGGVAEIPSRDGAVWSERPREQIRYTVL